ncbi:MAG: hypothetical protein WB558_06640 [Terriglobales bacterium]
MSKKWKEIEKNVPSLAKISSAETNAQELLPRFQGALTQGLNIIQELDRAVCHIQFLLHDARTIFRAYLSIALALHFLSDGGGRLEPHRTRSIGQKYLVRYLAQFGERLSNEGRDPRPFVQNDSGATQSVS